MTRNWAIEVYSSASSTFYLDLDATNDDLGDEVRPRPDMADWTRSRRSMWTEWVCATTPTPSQGWKVHVSATAENCDAILERVAFTAFDAKLDFKFVRNRTLLSLLNGKTSPRSASGKFITLYPPQGPVLEEICIRLAADLTGFEGPRILSDLRLGEGPVHVRYGAFEPRSCISDGSLVPALLDDRGVLVAEHRQPVFRVPPWVDLPPWLEAHLERQRRTTVADLPFKVTGALQFSNAGGVYTAVDRDSGEALVVLEGRPYAGVDSHGRDGRRRILDQARTLEKLTGVLGVPPVRGVHEAAQHAFLVVDHMPGKTLTQEMLDRHPYIHLVDPSWRDLEEYGAWAITVWTRLSDMVRRVHEGRVAHGDIHPDNVIISSDGQPHLLDFEFSHSHVAGCQGVGALGYQPPQGLNATEGDQYQLAALLLDLLLPIPLLGNLDQEQPNRVLREVAGRFQLNEELVQALRSALRLGREDTEVAERGQVPSPQGLLAGARASLHAFGFLPGSPTFPSGYRWSAWHGIAGYVHASLVLTGGCEDGILDELHSGALAAPATHGLLEGTLGIAAALDDAGRHSAARELVDRLLRAPAPQISGLDGGLAGDAAGLIELGARWADNALLESGLDRLAAVQGELPRDRTPDMPLGWCSGSAGLAWTHLIAYQATLDDTHLWLARQHLEAEATTAGDPRGGQFLLLERNGGSARRVPYIDRGSAGWALAAAWYQRASGDGCFDDHISGTLRACRAVAVREPGVANGRAGLAATLAALGGGESEVASEQIRLLPLQLGDWAGHQAVPGPKLLRLSMDLATGSLGVAIATDFVLGAREVWALHPLVRIRRTTSWKGGDQS